MSRPPSEAVIEAVERAERVHDGASLYGTFRLLLRRPHPPHHRDGGEQAVSDCARGCTQARRHVTDCPDRDTCRGCFPRQAEFGFLCYGCHKRLIDLIRAIPGQVDLLHAMAAARGAHDLTAETTAKLSAARPRISTSETVRGLYAHRSTINGEPTEPIRLACLDVIREIEDWLHMITCLLVIDHQMRGPDEETTASYARWLEAQHLRLESREDIADRAFAPGSETVRRQREDAGLPPLSDSLSDIMSRAHSLAPWRNEVARLHGIPCPECQATTLVRLGGDQDVTCIRCDATIPPERYGIWTRILAGEHRGSA